MTIFKHPTIKSLLLAATVLASPLLMATPMPALAQVVVGIAPVGIAIEIAPPVLPVYAQPPMPEVGYIWTPGYWAYGPVGYYWVPGTWIQPPMVGVLWTPPYWGWGVGGYLFHAGYWGQHVGFYGGVNYGYGYGGSGYDGGRWNGNNFAYNQSVNNFGAVHAANTYNQPVTVSNHSNVSYTGGTGGLRAEPTAADRLAEQDRHVPVTAQQTAHITASASNPALAASRNNGQPAIAATGRPTGAGNAEAVHAPTAAARTGVAEPAAHPAATAAAHAAVAPVAAPRAAEARAAATPVAHAAVQAPVAAHPAAARPAVARPAVARPAAVQPAVAHAPAARPAAAHPAQAAAPRAAPAHAAAPARAEEKKS